MINTAPFRKVMVVDDSFIDRYIITKILKQIGFANEIIEKESAQEALMELRDLSYDLKLLPDIIFLDIRMPVLSGFDFLDIYRSFPDTVRMKCQIYMLSGTKDIADIIMAEKNKDIKGFLQKPMLNEELLKKILVNKETITVK